VVSDQLVPPSRSQARPAAVALLAVTGTAVVRFSM
jgi:hypothetical protein